jgi:asparagine synthase (glutamine-hydrolysing)
MYSADRKLCITYNGEIFNFREIRSRLEAQGVTFNTNSDTEVILRGWERYGPDVLPMLRGMFALALWDYNARRGFLARDAFGIKPLYIAERGDALFFASEVKALLASEAIPRTLSVSAINSYLETGSVAEPDTIIEGITSLPAGSFVEITVSDREVRCGQPRRFALPFEKIGDDAHETAVTPSALRAVLRDSVAHHLVSDVPVGIFLSGGLDSSIIAALTSEVAEQKVSSFTVAFDEEQFSEAPQAREIASRFGTDHHEILLRGREMLDLLPNAFSAMDQPSLDGMNTFVVSKAVRAQNIKVVLSGLGGDELFGGYPSFSRAKRLAALRTHTGPLRRFAVKLLERSDDFRAEQMRLLLNGSNTSLSAYNASRLLFGRARTAKLMRMRPRPTEPIADDVPIESMSLLQQVSYYELSRYMRNTLLRDSDVFSMAHGLEVRVPFVDRQVANAAMRVPEEAKIKRGASKPFLFEAMRDVLPEDHVARPKRGFTLPFERWMRVELSKEIDASITRDSCDRVGLDHTEVRRVWNQFRDARGGMTWSRPWALYTLIRWAADHGAATLSPAPSRVESRALAVGG